MATVKDTIKESLVGASTEPQLSDQNRREFLQHAHKDEDGEYYMTEQEFINAIAPASEDYVRPCSLPQLTSGKLTENLHSAR